ncbi:hypothetical protein LguiA_004204 [Lonicera macranthoides]
MASTSTQFATSRRMGIYDPIHQISMWDDAFVGDISPNTGISTILQVDPMLDNKPEFTSHESLVPSPDNQATKSTSNKSQRRLAQNREAARKSRMRKKVYVQQLETSRLKLAQLEQELERARHQGVYTGGALNTGFSGNVNPGIVTFEMEYALWVEEQQKKNNELRSVLQTQISDVELHIFVDSVLLHYYELFRMKTDAARADVFYLMSGMWRTSVERFFLWIGGFRPSELLNVLMPQLEQLTDEQVVRVCNLRHSCQQAEDALSQGMDKLQQTLAQTLIIDPMDAASYNAQMASAMEKLDSIENFVNGADHLRQQTLQQMSRILTTRQTARALLTLGEYFHRLRTLTQLWAARPCEQPL